MAYYFELPSIGSLNPNQRLAVDEDEPVALSGAPGTGKTVVSLWRHINNHGANGINSLLLTYTKTLEYYLKGTAKTKSQSAAQNINRTLNWVHNHNGEQYDEIIIDEAQDVTYNHYNTISRHTERVSFGADDAQQVFNGCKYESLIDKFSNNEEYDLEINYRNSREIIEFVRAVFPNIYIDTDVINSAVNTGIRPAMIELGFGNFHDEAVDSIISIVEQFPQPTHNIGVLVISANQVIKFYNSLRNRITCSRYHSKMDAFEVLERIHISTFKSAKGLEFDTVIIPNFDSFDHFISDPKYKGQFSKNDYYVGLTRAKRNLFLLCKNMFDMNNYDTIDIR